MQPWPGFLAAHSVTVTKHLMYGSHWTCLDEIINVFEAGFIVYIMHLTVIFYDSLVTVSIYDDVCTCARMFLFKGVSFISRKKFVGNVKDIGLYRIYQPKVTLLCHQSVACEPCQNIIVHFEKVVLENFPLIWYFLQNHTTLPPFPSTHSTKHTSQTRFNSLKKERYRNFTVNCRRAFKLQLSLPQHHLQRQLTVCNVGLLPYLVKVSVQEVFCSLYNLTQTCLLNGQPKIKSL